MSAISPKRTFPYVAFDVAFGGKRTWALAMHMSAFDAKQTSRNQLTCELDFRAPVLFHHLYFHKRRSDGSSSRPKHQNLTLNLGVEDSRQLFFGIIRLRSVLSLTVIGRSD